MDGGAERGQLLARLDGVGLRDAARLSRRVRAARGEGGLDAVAREVAAAELALVERAASLPVVTYPEELPVSQRRSEIAAAIRDHQVVVVAGETGSGKTTQLPKILLELGRGVRGTIGHTQPRRIAARAVAERIAEELGEDGVGGVVGYAVRFTDQVGPRSLVKLMTDGILLAEVQRDRDLLAYDTIVIDEAHERSLTIDFLLGYLHRLLPRRPDLKVVVTSATIDPQRFAEHFATAAGPAPVVEVSGRTYPVEVRYRPLVEDVPAPEDLEADDPDAVDAAPAVVRDQVEAIVDAVGELEGEAPGDVLVFLSGEREIRDTADALTALELPRTEVVPLYARLSSAEQHRVFTARPRGIDRRIVLATNVAETSLTVPGIRYVIDPGTARISRYSLRSKVQRLPVEPVSRASADQRAGRCGRVADGVCIRLYSEADYQARPRFTDPEVLRTNLAAVLLRMLSLDLGDLEAFPFLDPPDRRQVRDGLALLDELGALTDEEGGAARRLTPTGRRLADLPVDPRLARMVVEAERLGVLPEVLVVVAALSVQDPRERPSADAGPAAQEAAAAAHRRFADEHSDLLAWLNLWSHLRAQQDELSSSAFRRACRAEHLHWLRVREWQDLHGQLRSIVQRGTSVRVGPVREGEELAAVRDAVHQALLAGLLSHVGLKDLKTTRRPQEFLGARGTRFAIVPGSSLAKRPPAWVVAGELVETSRLWGRSAARIDPEWVERAGAHLLKRSYSEPRWERRRAAAVATERATLYGLPVITGRTVDYARIDPALSRELFLRHALVEGEWSSRHAFQEENRRRLEEVEELGSRVRRRGLAVDEETLVALYDARIPADVVSARTFDRWWRGARRTDPDALTFSVEDLLAPGRADDLAAADEEFPLTWSTSSATLDLSYRFSPGESDDGVTVHVPVSVLGQLSSSGFDALVPGLRLELVTALLRGLPKPLRVQLVPVPDTARALVAHLEASGGVDGEQPLTRVLTAAVRAAAGVVVPEDAWEWSKVPPHLRATFVVEGEDGAVLARGHDLDALREQVRPALRDAVARAADRPEQGAPA
ncbi:MAG: ATP-dependent helicase HrpA, partial [uncultured Quadrisphaera sp.]